MAYRLTRLFLRNWLVSIAVLSVWFVYAALRDGALVHERFLGLSIEHATGVVYPPWIVIFVVEGILLAAYFLPNPAYSRRLRFVAAFFGVSGIVGVLADPGVPSRPLNFTLELVFGIYVFASSVAYAIFWPSDQDN